MQAKDKKQVLIRVTPDEHRQIKAAAATAHQSISSFMTVSALARARGGGA